MQRERCPGATRRGTVPEIIAAIAMCEDTGNECRAYSQSLPCAMRQPGLALSEQDLFTSI